MGFNAEYLQAVFSSAPNKKPNTGQAVTSCLFVYIFKFYPCLIVSSLRCSWDQKSSMFSLIVCGKTPALCAMWCKERQRPHTNKVVMDEWDKQKLGDQVCVLASYFTKDVQLTAQLPFLNHNGMSWSTTQCLLGRVMLAALLRCTTMAVAWDHNTMLMFSS